MFDAWEFSEKCKKCCQYDNDDVKHPITILDANTKLCEFCYEDLYVQQEKK